MFATYLLASSGAGTFGTSGSAEGALVAAEPDGDGDAVPPVVVVHEVATPAETTSETARTMSLLRTR
jgi:hypothetical protein